MLNEFVSKIIQKKNKLFSLGLSLNFKDAKEKET